MKLTTVLASVNNNPAYYMFIPKQIFFWGKFNLKFIAVFAGAAIPPELEPYKDNIILWTRNQNLKSAFIGQNIRIYYPALLDLPDDELVMITDMDMLPTNHTYYTRDLESFNINDFIYYRHIDGNEEGQHIFMCYNAAHPKTWGTVFGIHSADDVEHALQKTYNQNYDGRPGEPGWFTDQLIMYSSLYNYPHLKVLDRPINRLQVWTCNDHIKQRDKNFIHMYDDFHCDREYARNLALIQIVESQLSSS